MCSRLRQNHHHPTPSHLSSPHTPGCFFFRRDGREKVTYQAFLGFVGDHRPQADLKSYPHSQARLHEKLPRGKITAGGLDGWAWNEVKALSLSLSSGLLG